MKRLLIGLLLLLLVPASILLGAFAYLSMQDADKMRRLLESGLESSLGRDVSLDGPLKVSLSPLPALEVSDVTLGNARWASRREMLSIDKLELQPAVMQLLTGQIVLHELAVHGARLYLENGPDGQGNWQFEPGEKDQKSALTIRIQSLLIEDLRASYSNPTIQTPREIFLDSVRLNAGGTSDTVSVDITGEILNQPLSVSGTVGRFRELIAGRAFPVDLTASIGETSLTATGQIDDPDFRDYKGIRLDLKVAGHSPVVLKAWTDLDIPDLDSFEISGELLDSDGELALQNIGSDFVSGDYRLSLSGAIGHLPGLEGIALDFDGIAERIALRPPWANRPLDLHGRFSGKGHATGNAHSLGLERSVVSAKIDGGQLEIRGSVSDIGTSPRLDGSVSVIVTEPAKVGSQLMMPIPELDKMEMTGQLGGTTVSISLSDIRARLSEASLTADLSGSVGAIVPLREVALKVDIRGGNLADLSEIFHIDGLPHTDTASASGHLRGGADRLDLVFDDLRMTRGSTTRLRASGAITDLTRGPTLDARMQLTGANLQTLQTTAGSDVPETDDYEISGHLRGPLTSPDLQQVDARARLGDTSMTLKGDLPHVLDFNRIDARIEATGKDLSALGDRFGLQWPATQSFSLSGRAVGDTASPRIEELKGRFNTEQAHLTFTGAVQDILAGHGLDIDVAAEADGVTQFLPFGGFLWDRLGKSQATFSLRGDLEKFDVHLTQLRAGSSSLSGTFTYSRPGGDQLHRIEGAFDKSTLDLTPWIAKEEQPKPERQPDEAKQMPTPVFSAKPLPVSWMEGLALDVDLSAIRLGLGETSMDLVRGQLELTDRLLTLDPLHLRYQNAEVAGRVSLAGGDSPELKLQSVTRGLDIGNLARRAGLSERARGLLDLRLDLDAQGPSAREMAATAQGELTALMSDGFVGGADLPLSFAEMFLRLMPWLKDDRGMKIECMMLNLPVENGLAKMNFFVLDTTDMIMRGSGTIDLARETYDVLLVPRAKHARALAAKVDIKVRGPLGHPEIGYNAAATGLGVLEMAGRVAIFGPAGLFVGSDTFRKQRQKCAQSLDSVGQMK